MANADDMLSFSTLTSGEEEEVNSALRQPVSGTSSVVDNSGVWRRVNILERSGLASKSVEELVRESDGAWRRVVVTGHSKPTAAESASSEATVQGGGGNREVKKKTIRIRRAV
ncbi:unnamed protein product [Linum trigynum]|uniref:Uncharacterized protein n=1 Tax=Linum trigynum TaxID=586398 RepID=A0AAV2GGS5_9ROSI